MKKIVLAVILAIVFAGNVFAQDYFDTVPILDSVITANGTALSAIFDTRGFQIFKFKVPSTFDGTEITLYTSVDTVAANFAPGYDEDNTIYKFTVTAGRCYVLTPSSYSWIDRYVKLFSNVSATGSDKFLLTKQKYFKK